MKFINKICLLLLLGTIFLFSFINKSFAVAPSIISYPENTISVDTSFEVEATMSGLSNQTIYRLRLAVSKTGSSNYFGSTFNGVDWYNGLPSPIDYSKFLTITTDSNGTWFGKIQGKVESSDENFSGESGTYGLKIGRYTQNGSSATWSNSVDVIISAPSSTPTSPPATKIPTSTITPSSTEVLITQEKNTPTVYIKQKISTDQSLDQNSVIYENISTDSADILGASTPAILSTSASPAGEEIVEDASGRKLSLLFFLGGIMLFVGGGIFFYFRMKNRKTENT